MSEKQERKVTPHASTTTDSHEHRGFAKTGPSEPVVPVAGALEGIAA